MRQEPCPQQKGTLARNMKSRRIILVQTYGKGTPGAAEVGGGMLRREKNLTARVAPTG